MESRELPVEMPMAVEDAAVDLLRHFVQQQPTHRVEAERVLVRAGLGEGQMTEITETERQALNARLARAMGKQTCDQWECVASGFTGNAYAKRCSHQDCIAPEFWPPNFTRDLAASRSLVEWLDADENRWLLFEQQLVDMFLETCNNGVWLRALARWMMTADPLLIAQAADAALHQNQQ